MFVRVRNPLLQCSSVLLFQQALLQCSSVLLFQQDPILQQNITNQDAGRCRASILTGFALEPSIEAFMMYPNMSLTPTYIT